MTAERIRAGAQQAIGWLGIGLLAIAVGLLMIEVGSFERLTASGGLFVVLWPNLHWLLLWLITALAGFLRWKPYLLVLAALAPWLLPHSLAALGASTGRQVGIVPLDLLTWAQGAAQLLLFAAALLGLACWAWEAWSRRRWRA